MSVGYKSGYFRIQMKQKSPEGSKTSGHSASGNYKQFPTHSSSSNPPQNRFKCKELFATGLSRHKRMEHDGVRHICEFCSKIFKRKHQLRYHRKRNQHLKSLLPVKINSPKLTQKDFRFHVYFMVNLMVNIKNGC